MLTNLFVYTLTLIKWHICDCEVTIDAAIKCTGARLVEVVMTVNDAAVVILILLDNISFASDLHGAISIFHHLMMEPCHQTNYVSWKLMQMRLLISTVTCRCHYRF